jgi:hypothetical protein
MTLTTATYASVRFVQNLIQSNIDAQAAPSCSSGTAGDDQVCISSVYSSIGNSNGGDEIIITGSGFPMTTDEYSKTGLVAHYDAINNQGTGDETRDSVVDISGSTYTNNKWKNLAVPGVNDLSLTRTGIGVEGDKTRTRWGDKYFYIGTNSHMYWKSDTSTGFPTGSSTRTVEIIFKTPSDWATRRVNLSDSSLCTDTSECSTSYVVNLAGYGVASNAKHFGTFFQNASDVTTNYQKLLTPLAAYSTNCSLAETSAKNLVSASSAFITMSFVYKFTTVNTGAGYLNGGSTNCTFAGNKINTESGTPFYLGTRLDNYIDNAKGFSIYSYRLYNRELTAAEVKKNSVVDRRRFSDETSISVGGEACTNVTKRSDTEITCNVPAHATGKVDLSVTVGAKTATLVDGFEYVNTSISNISPAVGSATGSQQVTISGLNLPSSSSSDYIQDGLVAHYDGVDNIGLGDENRSTTTTVWANLASQGFNLMKTSRGGSYTDAGSSWTNLGYQIGSVTGTNGTGVYWRTKETDLTGTFPVGTAARTTEYIYKTPDGWTGAATSGGNGEQRGIGGYGGGIQSESGGGGTFWGHTFADTSGRNRFIPIGTNSLNCEADMPIPMFTDANKGSKLIDSSSTYNGNSNGKFANNTQLYLNGINATNSMNCDSNTFTINTTGGAPFVFGSKSYQDAIASGGFTARGFTLLSYRLYNRVLTSDEIMKNYSIDKKRFIANPVTIKIGNNDCTDIIFESDTTIKCSTPSGTANTTVDVKLYYNNVLVQTLSNVYKYAADGAIYVNSPTPSKGPVFASNQKITFTGRDLDSVTKITIGGGDCTTLVPTDGDTKLTCIVPVGNAGKADIIITHGGGTITIVGGFTYIDASENPVSYKVQRVSEMNQPAKYKLADVSVDQGWNGLTDILIKYPDGLTLDETILTDNLWHYGSVGDHSGGYYTKRLKTSDNLPSTSDNAADILNKLVFTAASDINVVGKISVNLQNSAWTN